MDDTQKQALIDAYLNERSQLVRARRTDRVVQVDLKLVSLGHQPTLDAMRRETAAAKPAPPPPPAPRMETTRQAPPEHTAEPSVSDHTCHCGRSFRTAAALGSHQRVHRDDDAES